MSISTFEADLEAMRETRQQMRALRKALERQLFGDEAYHREVSDVRAADIRATLEPPPDPTIRMRLNPLWAWNKRMRGR